MSTMTIELMDRAFQAERLGRFDEARDLLRRAVDAGESSLASDARLHFGRLLIAGGPGCEAEAEAVLTAARAQAEAQGASRTAAAAIHLLALLALRRRDPDTARRLLDESPVAQHAAIPGAERGQWLHYRGLLDADRGDLNGAERHFFRAHQVYREARHAAGVAEVCDSLANLLLRRGKAGYALTFARESLELKLQIGDRHGEAISHGTAGRALLRQARDAEAAAEFRQDLEISRELGDVRGVGIMLNSLGEVELLRKDPRAAEGYYREALGFEAGPAHAAHAHLGLARVLLEDKRPEEAAIECDQAGAILDAHPELTGLPHMLLGLRGAVAWRSGDHDEGERLLNAAIAALEAAGHPTDTIPLLYQLRDLHQSRQSRAEAVRVMARTLDVLSECGSERGVQDVEDWLRTVDAPKLMSLALEQHFPPWLVEGILGGHLRRPPSRKQEVAVLFSDVRDYTTLTEGLGAESIVALLNEWFAEATRAIRRHGGVVDKFIGDAVMALFGVPEPHEDAASQAVRAALAMRDALATMNMRQTVLGGREIRVGIGIDCGEAVVGFIGSHLRQSYTAIGDAVNTASRLESATKTHGCDILISGSVEEVQRAQRVAETRFVGRLRLKGKGQEVAAYAVLGHLEGSGDLPPG